MTEKLKLEFTNESGDRISWTSDSDKPFGFLTTDYWRICAEFYETLGYKNPISIDIGNMVGSKIKINFDAENGVY